VEYHYTTLLENESTLIEKFIEGIEYGIDARIINGQFELLLIREKILTKLPYRQEVGYLAPAVLNETTKRKIIKMFQEIISYMGVDECLFNADIIIKDQEIFIIECSGRPAGLNLM